MFVPRLTQDNAQEPGTNVLDTVIQKWQVDPEDQEALNALKTSYRVTPLRVFDINDNPVRVENMASLLKGALAEVHFSIHHWNIQRKGQVPQQSFSCSINQICVLKRAPPPPPSPYKSSSRPYRPAPMLPGPVPLLPAVELPVQAAAIQNTEETPLTPTTSRPDTDPHTPTPTSRTATAFGARLNFTQLPTPPDDIGTPPAVSVPASQVLGNHNVSPIQPESQGARPVPVIRPGQENIPILPSTLPNPANRGPLSLDPRTRTSQSLGMGHTAGRMQNLNAFTGSFNFNAPFRPQGVRPEQEIESTGNPIAAVDANGVLGAALEESMSASGDDTPNDGEVGPEPVATPENGVSGNPVSEVGSGPQGPLTIRVPPAKKGVQEATKSGAPRVHGKRKADSDVDSRAATKQRTEGA
ncbi:hypothetical protein EV421DRAFT_1731304 [Armillaria borealis]|uniref:Uncharacterized protein n=1 Tax=Armillaria borealis TaxID=47425 RepID=A0AA39K1I9_9AGAR|nr:hypothetical protein EV421DRAFT_1731304 [Armillaria borealis]